MVTMADELMEIFVDHTNEFTEILKPAKENIKDYFKQQNIQLPRGYRAEINLEAHDWIKEIAMNLRKGFVITIDYGFTSGELYSVKRKNGTLACYHKYSVNMMLYANIGKQDITAHVNFSALHFWGKNYGLEYTGFCDQHHFLHALGLADLLRSLEKQAEPEDREAFYQMYELLIQMGNKFKVLIQQKDIETKAIRGTQFATRYFE